MVIAPENKYMQIAGYKRESDLANAVGLSGIDSEQRQLVKCFFTATQEYMLLNKGT